MSDFNRNVTATPYAQTHGRTTAAVDEGLRAHMLRIYNYMGLALAITGFAALGTFMLSVTGDAGAAARSATGQAYALPGGMYLTSIGYAIFATPLKWVIMLSPLAMVFAISFGIQRLKPATAHLLFWAFAALMGISISSIFLVFTHTSIVRVFFVTAASFGALSLYGYTTQRDLTSMGSFLFMGLIGIILAAIVNIFVASSMLQFVISVVGVLVFAGLTAWDTQRLKNEYIYGAMDGVAVERSAILGALSLYLNFINLFMMLLHLLGAREE